MKRALTGKARLASESSAVARLLRGVSAARVEDNAKQGEPTCDHRPQAFPYCTKCGEKASCLWSAQPAKHTDEGPARCGFAKAIGGGIVTHCTFLKGHVGLPHSFNPQPAAKHTDDRQADTIPAWALKQHDQLLEYEIATLCGEEAIQIGENAVQCIIRVTNARSESKARAETRIEVLEAALRDIVEESHNDKRRTDEVLYNCRELARAALAAPSGETP